MSARKTKGLEILIDGAARGQGQTKAFEKDSELEGIDVSSGFDRYANTHGDAAIGVVIKRQGKLVGSFSRGLGRRTSNEAEYEALIAAMMICWGTPGLINPTIYSDSAVVVNQVNGKWQCKSASLRPLFLTVQQLLAVVPIKLVQVRRDVVYEADLLANLFLDDLLADTSGAGDEEQ